MVYIRDSRRNTPKNTKSFFLVFYFRPSNAICGCVEAGNRQIDEEKKKRILNKLYNKSRKNEEDIIIAGTGQSPQTHILVIYIIFRE